MLIDNSFKYAIASVFYDKTVIVHEVIVVQDLDGTTRQEVIEGENTFQANVRFDNLARVQEEYGIKEAIDVVITTASEVDNGVVVGYGDRLFEIIKVIPFDSHNMLVGKQCLFEYSMPISA